MRWLKYVFFLTFAAVILVACTENDDSATQQEQLVTPVEVTKLAIGTLEIEQTFYGKLSPDNLINIIPFRNGEISEVLIENGEEVEEGDVIARISPGNFRIEAPADGFIQQLTVKEGTLVSNTNPIGAIVSIDPIQLDMHATSDQLALFEKDQELSATINDEVFAGTVNYIAVMPDDSGLYPIQATIENQEQELKPGMIAQVNIVETKLDNELIIPTEALVEENNATYVYVVENNIAKKVQIEVLLSQTETSAIQGDVKEGDEIVVKGQLTLEDGSQVEIMKGDQ
ncbi:multidrug efflux pump subunit AcrA (membrane-fusion protein) [Salirhabdus euzebyi]|uniref:Multidrug efflux pump subunit AcrA (Membrane-fusion protein) n=1 Tax=Salirhabdus euzebyi TaxID=394506 RepID=A0A841Q6L3_9BACI|nr:efflux RND transporter periplasmic adaptor subunit [Salirhabdus euzebyi]MBB6453993.1 multidrug efflux pump subunit AcrA (membrane-fusion protein) [Salirhabdus euzebyi]